MGETGHERSGAQRDAPGAQASGGQGTAGGLLGGALAGGAGRAAGERGLLCEQPARQWVSVPELQQAASSRFS